MFKEFIEDFTKPIIGCRRMTKVSKFSASFMVVIFLVLLLLESKTTE